MASRDDPSKSRRGFAAFRAKALDTRQSIYESRQERDERIQAELDATFRTEVMFYRSQRDFEEDARIRHAYGWRTQAQSQGTSRAKVGSKVLGAGAVGTAATVGTAGCLPLGCAASLGSLLIPWRTKPKITVTWVKDPVTKQR